MTVVVVAIGCGTPEATKSQALGELIGRVERDQDVPQPGCLVQVEGTPRGARCDALGQFDIHELDAGRWDLRIVAEDDGKLIPARKITTAANPGFITDLGAIRIARPGKIGGHITVPPGSSLPFTVITVPGFPVATSPDPTNNGYLLERVPAGVHDVVLTTDQGDIVVSQVKVFPDQTKLDVNFDLAGLSPHQVNIVGSAALGGSSEKGGIDIDLVDAVGGTTKLSVQTAEDGTFVLPATSGAYVIRAHIATRHSVATVPSVIVHGAVDIAIAHTLVIPEDGDLDGDNVPDDVDDDTDGDGVPNGEDTFPLDFSESGDSDGDGLGNNSDLDSDGNGSVDYVPTPDADSDGKLDFEDNCVNVSNADQGDIDNDLIGNLCDNCPGVNNHDQLDSDNDGTGDLCESCIAGTTCTPANPCSIGLVSCTPNGPLCIDQMAPQPNGYTCGTDAVCFAGACAPCMNGGACYTSSGGKCVVGVQSCATGQEACLPTAALVPDGTPCGTDMVCDSGVCVGCAEGGACPYSPNPCHKGALSCDMGLPQTCEDSGVNQQDGTDCSMGGDMVCLGGNCVFCDAGDACTPTANPCHNGIMTCTTGTAVCTDQMTNAPNGKACPTAGQFCSNGACVTTPNTLSVVSGSPQTANVGAQLAPIVVRLADGGNNAIANQPLTIVPPSGGVVITAPLNTNTSGQSSFTVRLGPEPGPQTFQVLSNIAAPLSLTMTANAVPTGQMFTVVNVAHANATSTLPAPAAQASVVDPYGVIAAPDGSFYFSNSSGHRVVKVDGLGNMTVVAGTGNTGTPPFGDGGQAVNANLYYPQGLALDWPNKKLYIADSFHDRIRRVDLTSGVIMTFAGGATIPNAPYGDSGLATSAALFRPTTVALGANNTLYISDGGHGLLRKVSAAGIISTLVDPNFCVTGQEIGVSSISSISSIVTSANGTPFLAASICGTSINGSITNGIVRIDADDSLHHVAGNVLGTSGVGAEAKNTSFGSIEAMAFDTAGNLVVAEGTTHRVRRIDANTGIVSLIAGNGAIGTAGEYVAAATAPLRYPSGVSFDQNDLLFTDRDDHSVRRISGVNQTASGSIEMTAITGQTMTTIDRVVPTVTARLATIGGATNYTGLRVEWTIDESYAAVLTPQSMTNTSGLASSNARVGLPAQDYHVRATFQTIHGAHVQGSPAVFTLTAAAPAAGNVFTVLNTDRMTGVEYGVPGIATLARISGVRGMAISSTGVVYFSDDTQRIHKITPDGIVTTIAGDGNTTGLGDNGPALDATFYYPTGLALDEANNILYVADTYHHRVRAIDMTNDVVWTVAGSANVLMDPYGDGSAAVNAQLVYPVDVAIGPDNALYIADTGHNRIRRVDLLSPGYISTFVTGSTTACSGPMTLYNCTMNACWLQWIGNDLYIGAMVCGLNNTSTAGILRRNPDTSLTHIAGKNAGLTTEGAVATAADMQAIQGMFVEPNGTITYTERNRIRRIVNGMVTTIGGTLNTQGSTGDYGAATSALFSSPGSLSVHNGHTWFSEYGDYCMRVIW